MKKNLSFVNIELDPNFIGEVKKNEEGGACTFAEIWYHGRDSRPTAGRHGGYPLYLQFRFAFEKDTYCVPYIDLGCDENLELAYLKSSSGRCILFQVGKHKENSFTPLDKVYFTEKGMAHFIETITHFGIPISEVDKKMLLRESN